MRMIPLLRRLWAFTLIELLVVIAIIAILASVALPVYTTAMEKGRAVKDMNNLKQVGIGTLAYTNDNDGTMMTGPWAVALSGSTATSGNYIQGYQVFLSPFDKRSVASDAASSPLSYGLNQLLTTGSGANTSRWKTTSTLVLIAPNPNSSSPNEVTFSGLVSEPVTIAKPAASPILGTHQSRKRINVLYGDYHVETVRWQDYTSGTNSAKLTWTPF